nr:hypothetical protein CFP56_43287 [Quercus suber]
MKRVAADGRLGIAAIEGGGEEEVDGGGGAVDVEGEGVVVDGRVSVAADGEVGVAYNTLESADGEGIVDEEEDEEHDEVVL